MGVYQDIWKDGKLIEKGLRDCESRYKLIKQLVSKYKRPFTVLDFGANEGYFTIRLAEDFPDSTIVAIESHSNILGRVAHLNNVIVLNKQFTLKDLETLNSCEYFDVVLCTSVLHHFTEKFDTVLDVFLNLGSQLVLELPVEEGSLGSRYEEMNKLIESLGKPKAFIDSHVGSNKRPLYILKGKAPSKLTYNRFSEDYLSVKTLNPTLKNITVTFPNKKETRDWIPGINLWTYVQNNGSYPNKENIAELIKEADWENHHDIVPWNIIIAGKKIFVIDKSDPGHSIVNPISLVDKIVDLVINNKTEFQRD